MQASSFLQMTVAEIGRRAGLWGSRSCGRGRAGSVAPVDASGGGPDDSWRAVAVEGRSPCSPGALSGLVRIGQCSAPRRLSSSTSSAPPGGGRASRRFVSALPIESEILPAVDGRAALGRGGGRGLCRAPATRRATRSRSPGRRSGAFSAIAPPGAGSSTKASTTPSCSRTTRRSTPSASPRCSICLAAERARWSYVLMPGGRARAGGRAAGAARRRRRSFGPSSPPLPRHRAGRVARGGRTAARGHRAVRPPGRHLSADELGDRRHPARRHADA